MLLKIELSSLKIHYIWFNLTFDPAAFFLFLGSKLMGLM